MTIVSDTGDSPLWQQITSWDNLWLAYHKAAKGKRGHGPAATFEFQLADNLLHLQAELLTRMYTPGEYTHFYIWEPKRRLISAAPFRDRVVHHALCNVIEPMFEDRFHPESYANRIGKGTHAAVDRVQQYARRYRYVLRCDVVQHFPSLDHAILRRELARGIRDDAVLWLVDRILASGEGVLRDEYDEVLFPGDGPEVAARPRGLPIGNLTSQFWSNVYLNSLDWFITRELRCPAMVRYVDDIAIFADDKRTLWAWKRAIIERLAALRLTMHEGRAQVTPVTQGIPWLGFVVFPEHRRVKAKNAISYRQRLERQLAAYAAGQITFEVLDASVQGWINHIRYADTYGLRRYMFQQHPIPRRVDDSVEQAGIN